MEGGERKSERVSRGCVGVGVCIMHVYCVHRACGRIVLPLTYMYHALRGSWALYLLYGGPECIKDIRPIAGQLARHGICSPSASSGERGGRGHEGVMPKESIDDFIKVIPDRWDTVPVWTGYLPWVSHWGSTFDGDR